MLLLSLLAHRTCSPATAGASSIGGQTECKCVCVHHFNHWLSASKDAHLSRQTSDTGSSSQKKKKEKTNTVYFITCKWKMSFVNKWPIYFPSHQWTRGTWFIFSVLEAMEWKGRERECDKGGEERAPAAFMSCGENHQKNFRCLTE